MSRDGRPGPDPAEVLVREMTEGEAEAVSRLVLETFHSFVGPDFSDEGIAEFTRFVEPDAPRARVEKGSLVLVATVGGQPAGTLEIRPTDHISMLFVAASHQRRGLARKLFERAVERASETVPGDLTVNSSRFAVPVYERLGFHATGEEQTVNGITFVPMVYERESDGR